MCWGSTAVGLRAAKMCQPGLLDSSMVYWTNERMRNSKRQCETTWMSASHRHRSGKPWVVIRNNKYFIKQYLLLWRMLDKHTKRALGWPTGSSPVRAVRPAAQGAFPNSGLPGEAAVLGGTARRCFGDTGHRAANSFVQTPAKSLGLS